jgi:hypothetical protein
MKYQYSLQIPAPCSENWDEMTAAEMGRFCAHCQETVIDFSEMTDNEIATFLHAHANEKICGNITLSQSYKKYVFVEPQITTSPVKRYVMAMLAALMVAAPTAANATHIPLYTTIQKLDNQKDTISKNIISAHLIDIETDKPIAFAKIVFGYDLTKRYLQRQIIAFEREAENSPKYLSKHNKKEKEIYRKWLETLAKIEKYETEYPKGTFCAKTDKEGYFSIELPSNLPKNIDLTLEITLLSQEIFEGLKEKTGEIPTNFPNSNVVGSLLFYYKGGECKKDLKVRVYNPSIHRLGMILPERRVIQD